MRSVLHKPSFEEEEVETAGNQSWFDQTRGSVILLWIPSVLFFNVLDHRCCATCWGRDLKWLCKWCLEDLPHTYSCTCFLFERKTIQTRTLPVLDHRGVKFYWGKVHEMLKCPSFFLLLLFSLYVYLLFSFYYGKLGIMGNFAEWRNEWGCTRYVESLLDGTYQSLNKDARVKLYIHKAKPCILFCLALLGPRRG